MTDVAQLQDLIGRTAVDPDGNKIGKIEQIYLDDRTGEPQWVTVSTGLFGNKQSFAPLRGSSIEADSLRLAVSKDMVKDAPNLDADGHLEDSENDALYAHYAGYYGAGDEQTRTVDTSDDDMNARAEHFDGDRADFGGNREHFDGDRADIDATNERTSQGHDTSGPNTDNAMTRSEEQLRVGTEKVETGRARLRKYVVTENVTTTVPVTREEVRIEREPITDANRDEALSGGDITEEEHEIKLHAERPVVEKETVPVERVRMSAETVTDENTVTEEVRKEKIDTPETR